MTYWLAWKDKGVLFKEEIPVNNNPDLAQDWIEQKSYTCMK